jgi:tetratricopeptide (TPR) repeat protein
MMKKSLILIVAFFVSMSVFAQQEAKVLIGKANEALQAKNYLEAFDLYEKAMSDTAFARLNKSFNYNIALAAKGAEKNEAALKYFDKSIEIATSDASSGISIPKCYENKASVYVKLKDLPNALQNYEKAMELYPEKPGSLLMNAGGIAFNLSNYEKAIGYFDQAIAMGFKPEDALLNKAGAYKKMNNDSMYMETLLAGNAKFPENKKFSGTLSGIYVMEGNKLYKGGLDLLNATNKKLNEKKLKAEDAEYKNSIAKVNEEYAKAVEVLKKALALDPANVSAPKLIEACKPVK